MKVTTEDIARICGVSRGTVDRALNNRPGISPITKEKILKVADELGYRPNMIARSLVTGQTMSIGVIVFDLYNEFFAQLLNSMESRAREKGYFTYLTLTDKNPSVEKECLSYLTDRNVDGIILLSVNKGADFNAFLKMLNKPIVSILNFISPELPFVGANDKECMEGAVQYAVDKGYKNLIYVSPPLARRNKINMYTLEERLQGFKKGCNDNGILESDCFIVKGQDYIESIDNISDKGLSDKTAILCSSDIYALEISEYLDNKGIRIPNDVGLMGFDNINSLKYVKPGLTTIAYPIDEIANQAVDILISSINGEEVPASCILNYSIIERDSL